ncbi:MAG: Mannosyl-glycoproteindo-beta-N-acetylglucosamidase, partial [Berkelbacteria bacterium GW2011_GWA2_38_9]
MADQEQPNQPEETEDEPTPQPAKKGFDTKFFLMVLAFSLVFMLISQTPLLGLGLFWLNRSGLQSRYSGNLGFGPGYMFDTDVATGDQLDQYLASKGLNELVAKGYGQSAVKAGKAIGINPIFILSLARHEGGDRLSPITRDKNNPFGYGAVDGSAYKSAKSFPDLASAFQFVVGKIQGNYLQPSGPYYASPEKLTEWGSNCEAVTTADPGGEKKKMLACTEKADLVVKTAGGDGIVDFQKETVEAMNIKYATHIYWANAIKSKMEDAYEFLGIEAFRDNPNTAIGETGGWAWPLGPNKPLKPHTWAGHSCFMVSGSNNCSDYGRSNMGEVAGPNKPVYAIGNGTITFQTGDSYGSGGDPYMYWSRSGGYRAGYNAVFTSTDGRVKAFYAHIYRVNVANKPTFQVSGNEKFAQIYNSHSPHLHFELMIDGRILPYNEQGTALQDLINSNPTNDGTAITGTGIYSEATQKPLNQYDGMEIFTGKPTYIILHYTASNGGVNSTWSYFEGINKNNNSDDNKYVQFDVAKDGTIYQFMPETRKVAGACGYNIVPSQFGGGISISVENEGYFTAAKPATQAQVDANAKLVSHLMSTYNIPKSNVISHQEARRRVSQVNPGSDCPGKSDPGSAFMTAVLGK